MTRDDHDAAADLLAMAERIAPGGNDAAAVRNGIVLPEFVPFIDRVAELRTASEQRGYDRAIAEVVAWLRGGTNVIGLTQEVADRIVTYLECVELPAIEAGEHKP